MQLRWTQALALNHPIIDTQHQEIFRRYGALEEGAAKGDRAAAVGHLDFLGQYAVEHFGAEERLMEETGYPDLAAHRAAHERFVSDYVELVQGFMARQVTMERLVEWTGDWLKVHIAGADLLLASFLAKRG